MNKKTFYLFRFLAGLSIIGFTYYINFQATWALVVGMVLVYSYVFYIEIALHKNVFKSGKDKPSKNSDKSQ